jgi:hypothetical protein
MRALPVLVAVLTGCGGASKTHSNAAAPAAAPIAPARIAESPATTPTAEPAQPEPTKPEQVAIAEDPDAGGEVAEDPDAGGEVSGGLGVGGGPAGGGGAGGGGVGTRGGIGTVGTVGRGSGTSDGFGGGGGRGGAGAPTGGIGTGYPGRRQITPTLQWGMPTVNGELDRDVVRRVVRRHGNELRYCYEQELALNPRLRGLLVIKLVIDAEGKVTSASASGVGRALEACVATRARSWLFPKPKKGVVSVAHPVTFSPP